MASRDAGPASSGRGSAVVRWFVGSLADVEPINGRCSARPALLPIEAVLWVGFALPFPWPISIARAAIIALAERSGR
jgi:hypothetical protein